MKKREITVPVADESECNGGIVDPMGEAVGRHYARRVKRAFRDNDLEHVVFHHYGNFLSNGHQQSEDCPCKPVVKQMHTEGKTFFCFFHNKLPGSPFLDEQINDFHHVVH